tara:strand:- start:272 stop:952 length:681 start_codon:yes stop_codon:yes gene_type:complete
MAKPYFRNLSDFEYVNRTSSKEGRSFGDYTKVKNLFKKGKLREDIFQDTTFFTKYTINGDDRPDNVADEIYGDSNLDWIVLLSNNIINIQSEWPMSQADFNTYLTEKYDSETEIFSGIHHYEANQVETSEGVVIIPSGMRVGVAQSVTYFDFWRKQQVTVTDIALPVTNYTYEEKINNDKRNIYLLKSEYLNIVFDDMEEMMTYKEGSTQYVSETLVRGENPRLYN